MKKEELDMDELTKLVDEKIEMGKVLIKRLAELQEIDGVKKIQRNMQSELKFLEKVLKNLFCSQICNLLLSINPFLTPYVVIDPK
jgi:uncharacterized protein involved in cysteine biosynthesis